MSEKKPNVLRVKDRAPEETFSHPYNPRSEISGTSLSDATGLSRIGVHLLRVPPGREAFVYHSHHTEEEWCYVVSGRGLAVVDGVEHALEPGDFLGFPTPSVAHVLKNPSTTEDLVYLSGGERHPAEVADFPDQKKRLVRVGGSITVYPLEAGEHPFPGVPKL
ncbi:MAG TPA: cupin domain-containing protein [Aggregicoccus sp.]|nr:cupin domain-containing protein [Aggregicoccus sp.]